MKRHIRSIAIKAAVVAAALTLSGCGWFGSGSDSANIMPEDMIKKGPDGKIRSLTAEEYNTLAKQHKDGTKSMADSAGASDPYKLEVQGDNLVRAGDYESAMFKYQRALQLVPEQVRPRLKTKLGFSLLKQKRFKEAVGLFESIKKPGVLASQVDLGLGLAKLSLGEYDQAEASLNSSIRGRSVSWKAYNALGIINNRYGRHKKAAGLFKEAIAMRPKQAALYNNLGLAQMKLEQAAKAEMSFIKALRLDPDNVRARNNLGLLYSSQGRWQEARQSFTDAMGEAKAHNNLGVLLAYGGQYLKAQEHFRKAVENSPTYYGLADRHYNRLRGMGGLQPISYNPGQYSGLLKPRAAKPKQIAARPQKRVEAAAIEQKNTPQSVEKAPAVKVETSTKDSGYRYFLQVATLRDFNNAQKVMNHWMGKGYSCQISVWTSKKNARWYRILVGPYQARAELQTALAVMRSGKLIKDYVVVRRKVS
jgi:Flp pilus assembly protein TadD/cell division septation protein DedD